MKRSINIQIFSLCQNSKNMIFFLVFPVFFLETKKLGKSGKKLFDKNDPNTAHAKATEENIES